VTGAIIGMVAVLLPMVGVTLGVALGLNKTLQGIARKVDEIHRSLDKEDS
jgi:cell division protein FtsX